MRFVSIERDASTVEATGTSAGTSLEETRRRVVAAAGSVFGGDRDLRVRAVHVIWDLGMNSVMAVSLASALEREFGVRLPASVAFDYGTLAISPRSSTANGSPSRKRA